MIRIYLTPISQVGAGDLVLYPPIAGQTVRVIGYLLSVSSTCVLTWKSGIRPLSGPMTLNAGWPIALDVSDLEEEKEHLPYLQTLKGDSLVLSVVGSATVGGFLVSSVVSSVGFTLGHDHDLLDEGGDALLDEQTGDVLLEEF